MTKIKKILCYGDSLTAGYTMNVKKHYESGLYIQEYYPWADLLQKNLQKNRMRFSVDHVGMSGWTIKQMLDNSNNIDNKDICGIHHDGLNVLLKKNNYDYCIIMVGTNDLTNISSKQIFDNIIKLHISCHNLKVRSIVIPILDSLLCHNLKIFNDKRNDINQKLRNFCDKNKDCIFLDVNMPFNLSDKNWEKDGLHMTCEGYKNLGNVISNCIIKQKIS